MIPLFKKCKHFDHCDYVQKEGYTCNHDEEARHYCGKYKDNELR
jgi:hypothetical protein